jgi:uncharacterized membrane protein
VRHRAGYAPRVSIGSAFLQFLVAAAVVTLIDLAWLTLIAKRLYRELLDGLLAEKANGKAAVLFYAVFIAGLVWFVIGPAVDDGSLGDAVLNGAIYGLVTYATWDLTNLSVLEGFPARLVPIDIAWGMVLATATATATYGVWQLVG